MPFSFALIAPYQELAQLTHEVCNDLGIKGEIFVGDLQEGIEITKKIKKTDVDVIISRGGTATVINREIDLPVVEIAVSGFDLIHAVSRARAYGKNIGVIGFKNVIYGTKSLDKILGVNIYELQINNESEVKNAIIKAQDLGIEVIIGDAVTKKYAQKMNLKSVLVTSGKEAISMAIREAEKVAIIRKKERIRSEQLKAILDFSYEGIIATDYEGKVSMVNPAAEGILSISSNRILGKVSSQVVPSLNLDEVIKTSKSELGKLSRVGEKLIVQNTVPVIDNGELTGIVSTFQDASYIQYVENKVRKELLLKGHVAKYTFNDIVTNNDEMIELIKQAKEFAKVDSTLLVTGETGSGKELFAQSIHNHGNRKNGPFVAVNCASIPENLLESELFGYEEGAFTGARKKGKKGFFELAHGGTLFLDEIGEIPLRLQAHLLRVLQQKVIVRVGGDRVIPTDVRVIAATHRDLEMATKEGKFRSDLYYRINVLRLKIPSLRKRKEDIPILIKVINERKCIEMAKDIVEFDKQVISVLKKNYWRGNIRELENVLETLIIMKSGEKVEIKDLIRIFPEFIHIDASEKNIEGTLEQIERKIVLDVLQKNENDKVQTCKQLGISQTTLWRRLKKWGIEK